MALKRHKITAESPIPAGKVGMEVAFDIRGRWRRQPHKTPFKRKPFEALEMHEIVKPT